MALMASQGGWPGSVDWIKKDSQVAAWKAMLWSEMLREAVLSGRVRLIGVLDPLQALAKGKCSSR